MFRVYLPILLESCVRMQSQARSWECQINEIDRVISVLASMSGMEAVLTRLRRMKDKLIKQRNSLIEMLLSLERLIRVYDSSEKSIISNAEGNMLPWAGNTVGVVTGITNSSSYPIKARLF